MAEAAPSNGTGRPGGAAKRSPAGTGNRPAVGTGHRPAVGTGTRALAGTGPHRSAGGAGGKVALLVVAMLVAGGVGAGLAFKDELFGAASRVTPPTPPRIPPRVTPPPPTPPPPTPVPVPPTPPPPTPPPTPAGADNGAAEKAIAEGKNLLAKISYEAALRTLGSVETMKVSPELAKEAAALARKAQAFHKLTRDVKLRPDADQVISVLELADGKKLRGVVARKPDGSYSILTGTPGGGQMTLTLAAADVRDVKEIDPAERRAELKKALNTRLAKLGGAAAPPELFDVAVFAIENGLREESLAVLERAWDGAEAVRKDLVRLVAEDQAGKLLNLAIWSDSIGQEIYARRYCEKIRGNAMYQGTVFSADAEKMLAMLDERKGIKNYRPSVEVTGVQIANPDAKPAPAADPVAPAPEPPKPAPTVRIATVSSKVDINEANRLFSEGMNYYFKAMPGMADCKANQAEARTRLRKAQQLYEEAVKRDPDNSQLQSRMTDCNKYLYGIMKMSTL